MLLAENKTQQGRVYCSAAVAVRRPNSETWAVAEVGDTKVFLEDRPGEPPTPVWPDGLPTADHQLGGALGSDWPRIRTREVAVPDGGSLVLLTDGAFHLLHGNKLAQPDGVLNPAAAERFPELLEGSSLADDATLVRITPPVGASARSAPLHP